MHLESLPAASSPPDALRVQGVGDLGQGPARLAHLDFAHDLGFSLYLDQATIKGRIEINSNFPVEQISVVDLMPGYSTYGKS